MFFHPFPFPQQVNDLGRGRPENCIISEAEETQQAVTSATPGIRGSPNKNADA